MKKALLFGANGYIGRHIADSLLNDGVSFIPLDIQPKSKDNLDNYQQLDITQKEQLKKLDFDVDIVYFFAGISGTKLSQNEKEVFSNVNIEGLKNVLSNCRIKGLRFVYPSSRLVYKGKKDVFLVETDEKEAKSHYAMNKLTAEKLISQSGIDYSIFRICVPYGNLFDNQYSYGTIGHFLKMANEKQDITVYGDGSSKRTFSHIADIVRIIIAGGNSEALVNQTVNIGSNDSMCLKEVACFIAAKYDVGVRLVDWPKEDLKIETGDTIFSDEKFQKLFSYKYEHSLKDWV
jgi:UDP-glucose 4-epimerase